MIRIVDTSCDDWRAALRGRAAQRDASVSEVVAGTIQDVRARGDEALLDSARRFDAPDLDRVLVSAEELDEASLAEPHLAAIRTAAQRVREFHDAQRARLFGGWGPNGEWRVDGVGQRVAPVRTAGIYVPGGAAAYPSSVLMNAIPAQVADVREIIVTTPARADGTLHPAVLVALREIGVRHVAKVGGAAAIAALAIGTESVPRTDVIAGPGNRYVNEAKRQLWGEVGLDGYAGPSEVAVVIDASSNPAYAAADLLTQIEHASDNCGFLIAIGEGPCRAVLAEVECQVAAAPREATMRAALAGDSLAVIVRDVHEAAEVVDALAPEHLSLATRDPAFLLTKIRHAGCILLGEWSPESAGDFAAGPSHTLPTSGAARFASPLNVLTFLRLQSVISLDRSALAALKPVIEAFGEMEGFPQHARGAAIRRTD